MPNQRLRGLSGNNWWRKWSTAEWAAVAVAAAILLLTTSFISNSNKSRSKYSSNHPTPSESNWVPLTLLSNAQQKGAFCLDGSVPGYHIQSGFGSGSNSWLLHFEGGGWCSTLESCSARKRSPLGSSKYMDQQVQFSGILSNDPSQNPDFFNWNRVKLRYCDGASYSGNPQSEPKNGTEIFFRGQVVWDAFMDELLSLGLSNAKQALLTGCSAGGLGILIHCDSFQEILPKDATVKCLSDGGFFLNEKDIAGQHSIENFYHNVVRLQMAEHKPSKWGELNFECLLATCPDIVEGVASSLNKDCLSKVESHKCFFPQEFIRYMKTPIFLVNSAYDWWQIQNILVPDASDPNASWLRCKMNIHTCNPDQLKVLQGFRDKLLETLSEFQQNKESGMFINSCFVHCQTWKTETWHSPSSPRINNKTIAESVGDWYFNRGVFKHIDCPFPCNPTCINEDFGRGL